MRLLGARTIDEVVPAMVDSRSIGLHTTTVPSDELYSVNCKCSSASLFRWLADFPADSAMKLADLKAKL